MKHPLLLLPLCGVLGCQPHDPTPVDQLPPATQTGANTFACLVNGQLWTPSAFVATTTFGVSYDPAYLGGALQVKVKRYTGAKNDQLQALTFGAANVQQVGVYDFPLHGSNGIFYTDTGTTSCGEYGNPSTATYQRGTLTITRLDLTQGIIAGTFSFTVAQPGCDTLRIEQGRFDKRL